MCFHAKLLVQKHPCTSCVILNGLNMETMEKVKKLRDDFTFEIVEINDLRELYSVEGLELEKLPAVLVNNEQLTAGTILPPKRLMKLLDDMLDQ